MRTFTLLGLSATVLQGVAATGHGWRDQDSYSVPTNIKNECTTEESYGFDWSDLDEGSFDSYNGYSFSGWDCVNKLGKRNLEGRTFNDKCIETDLDTEDYSNEISYDKSFSIGHMDVSVDEEADVEFHYGMPDGTTCKQTRRCGTEGTTVENDQCGGANSVKVKLPKNSEKKKCKIGVHKVKFECGTTTTSVPVPTTTLPPLTPSTTPEAITSTVDICTVPADCTGDTCTMPPGCGPTTPTGGVGSLSSTTTPVPPGTTPATETCTIPVDCTEEVCAMPPGCPTTTATVPLPTTTPDAITSSIDFCPPPCTGESCTTYSSDCIPTTTTVPLPTTTPDAITSSIDFCPPPCTGESCTTYSSDCIPTTTTVPLPTTTPDAITSSIDIPPVSECSALPPPPTGGITYSTDFTVPVDELCTPPPVATVTETCTPPAGCTGDACTMPAGCPPTMTIISTISVPTTATTPDAITVPGGCTTGCTTGLVDSTTIGSSTIDAVSSTTSIPPVPVVTMPPTECPDVLPRCLKTWLFITSCIDSADPTCFCPEEEFVTKVVDCLSAWGADDNEVATSVEYFLGICQSYIPGNPAIITAIPPTITLPSPSTNVPVVTITHTATTVVPCEPTTITVGPSSGSVLTLTTSFVTTTVTIPQVTFVVTATDATLVYPTKSVDFVPTTPAPTGGDPTTVPAKTTTTAPVTPLPSGVKTTLTTSAIGSSTRNATIPTGTGVPIFTGTASSIVPATIIAMLGAAAALMLQL